MNILTPRQALNKAYLKQKVYQQHLEKFRLNFLRLLEHRNAEEGEEHNKKLLSTFLEDTWYKNLHYINTSGRTDMAIYEKPSSDSQPVVLIETKRPGNSSEMPTAENLNTKALHELISYYLYQRVEKGNKHIRHLVITDLEAFFIFDENEFDRFFYGNRQLVNDYKEFKNSGKSADFFYKEIAQHFVAGMKERMTLTHFSVKQFRGFLKSRDPEKTRKLIPYFKLLSPEHLLKKPFANDSNTLDRNFYHELLHIIGLREVKKGSQKLIQRAPEEEREAGSLMENTITILEAENTVHYMAGREKYGSGREEQTYNVALELVITWINRVLFLKLLEAQLVRYHRNDKTYKFLDIETLPDYDALNKLFFQVLAVEPHQRNENVRERFAKVPYLNSSLFETNELERNTIRINSLENEFNLPYLGPTVLKNNKGRRRKGKENPLHYLFEFLEAYDFASEGSEDIQEENKNLINASVLGLIFEKINGYRDGSFFTPGFITEYMARETIRRAVVQKFNEQKGWQVEDFEALRDKIEATPEGRAEANTIINSLKIVDPAVGSGHFLVSALNEIIALKSELKVLCYRNGNRIRYYHARVENDELIIEDDEEGSIFEYHLSRSHTLIKEKQEVQEAIFHEKQTIIENCLFGVDINPNSVKICRLRLWIELLKNAYYQQPAPHASAASNLELQTLPNIDINIKVGNSLVSRFALDDSLKKTLSSSKWSIDSYRVAVHTYRNAEDKEQKREMQDLIDDIKSDFTTNIDTPFKKKLSNAKAKQINTLTEINTKQQWGEKIPADLKKKLNNASKRVVKLEEEKKEIENSVIYRNAFEWRFEFPEVLDDDGNFIGFDVVIGNPPYIRQEQLKEIKPYLSQRYEVFKNTADILVYFVELGMSVLKPAGGFSFIISNKFLRATYGEKLRGWLKQYQVRKIIDFGDLPVFEEASTYPMILAVEKRDFTEDFTALNALTLDFDDLRDYVVNEGIEVSKSALTSDNWNLTDKRVFELIEKLRSKGTPLEKYVNGKIFRGVLTGLNEAFVIDEETRNRLIEEDAKSEEIIKPFLAGRDIKRYKVPEPTHYLMFARRGIDIERYPAVLKYLEQYHDRLKPRPKDYKGNDWPGRKPGSYKWYEIQDAIDYYEEFEKPKIIYPNICRRPEFTFDEKGNYTNQKCFIITEASYHLLAILNSRLMSFYFEAILPKLRGNYYEPSYFYMRDFPVIENVNELANLAEEIMTGELNEEEKNVKTEAINRKVYELYGLSEEEVEIVEK